MTSLQARPFIGTESRLHAIVDLLRQIVHGAETDPDIRLSELRRAPCRSPSARHAWTPSPPRPPSYAIAKQSSTTDAALFNGYVYDEPPTGPLDRLVTDGDYAPTHSHAYGYVSLMRQHVAPTRPAKPSRSGVVRISAPTTSSV